MPEIYSVDLRERVLEYVEKHNNKKEASHLFRVGIATFYRWVRQKKEKGNLNPLRRKYGYKTRRFRLLLSDVLPFLREALRQ